MKPTGKTEGSASSASEAPNDEGRREALKRFGKLAAAAPVTMLLLQSRRSNAADCAYPQ